MVKAIQNLMATTGGKAVKLRDFKEAVAEAFQGQSMAMAAVARISNRGIRVGLLLRCVSLQAKAAASLNAALVAEGVPEEAVIKAAEIGEAVAAEVLKQTIKRMEARGANEAQTMAAMLGDTGAQQLEAMDPNAVKPTEEV